MFDEEDCHRGSSEPAISTKSSSCDPMGEVAGVLGPVEYSDEL